MCGIVGYVGTEDCAPFLIGGLRRLEYRGYDSSGVAIVGPGGLGVIRARGKLANIEGLVAREQPKGSLGIGHTRWATHGRPSDENAHPHAYKGVAVVHNGIIENHLELKEELRGAGHVFSSETDTEIFAHLIHDALAAGGGADLLSATRKALGRVRGTYALAVVSQNDPDTLVAAKNASPLVVGYGSGENYLASDVPALLEKTRDVSFLEEGEFVRLRRGSVEIWDAAGRVVTRKPRRIEWTPVMAEKGGHKHFMHKEIHEQPRAVVDTIRGRASVESGDVVLDGVGIDEAVARGLQRVTIIACGTSFHAGLVGKHYIESLARIPVEIDLASEYRYRDPLVVPGTLCVAISQSGETVDTLIAMREAKSKGARTMALCNVLGSAIPRESDDVLYTHAGPEIGVASTKCFTTQLAALLLVAVRLGRLRGTLTAEKAREVLTALRQAPLLMEETLRRENLVLEAARRFSVARDVLFLGRGTQAPVALEGALKLKEISYVHAEGYAAGEMKHGPIALIDEHVPVVVLATKDPFGATGTYEKMIGNIEEVRARSGKVIAVVNDGDEHAARLADAVMRVPAAHPLIAPIVNVLPLQLFAYHVADHRGTDVDQPRNLAKSVTVE
jgi:glucosamine--fructose-6-phosphate aminotransferase (isomerizing)